MSPQAVVVREAAASDRPAITELLAEAMGRQEDPRFEELLRWKHQLNPFGVSPAWVAVVEGAIAGYRSLLRWEFDDGHRIRRAVRAVDTATHPDHQGKGIFRQLTLHAIDAVAAEGVEFVFNTPNDSSRPGYLKMGWQAVGSLRPWVRPAGLSRAPAILRGRGPASHWGEATAVGGTAAEVFADDRATQALVDSAGAPDGRLRTRRTPAYLRWRYDAELLGYRVLTMTDDLAEGAACFRLRRRGGAVEATIGDVLVPSTSSATARRLIAAVLHQTGAHYALVLGGGWRSGLAPVPGRGPMLVWRGLHEGTCPRPDRWALTMGDIELF